MKNKRLTSTWNFIAAVFQETQNIETSAAHLGAASKPGHTEIFGEGADAVFISGRGAIHFFIFFVYNPNLPISNQITDHCIWAGGALIQFAPLPTNVPITLPIPGDNLGRRDTETQRHRDRKTQRLGHRDILRLRNGPMAVSLFVQLIGNKVFFLKVILRPLGPRSLMVPKIVLGALPRPHYPPGSAPVALMPGPWALPWAG